MTFNGFAIDQEKDSGMRKDMTGYMLSIEPIYIDTKRKADKL